MKLKLGELLVREKVLTPEQLADALAYQKRHPGYRKLGETILQLKFTTEDRILTVLSRALNIPAVDLSRVTDVEGEALAAIDVLTAERELVMPLRVESVGSRRRLLVAMADPTNLTAVDKLQFKLGMGIVTRLSTISQIRLAIQRFYRRGSAAPSPIDVVPTASADPVHLIQEGDVRTWVGGDPKTGDAGAGPFVPSVAELRAFSGPARGESFSIPAGGTVVIGRGSDADVVVNDGRMSRRHFHVRDTGSTGIELVDLQSSNGTYVNKKLAQRATLHQGDWVQAGNSLFQLHILSS